MYTKLSNIVRELEEVSEKRTLLYFALDENTRSRIRELGDCVDRGMILIINALKEIDSEISNIKKEMNKVRYQGQDE